jgi:hypothetical protein
MNPDGSDTSEVSAETQARLASAAELSDPERVSVLEEIYSNLEAELERELPSV